MRIGIIGSGQMAQVHLSWVQALRLGEIVGICDLDQSRAQQTAKRFNIPRTYQKAADLFEQAKPELVHVVTPPPTHASLVIEALEAGCHVFVDKPMALTLDDADRMIKTAERTQRRLCVNHNHLFDPVVLEAKSCLERGELGQLLGMDCFQGFGLSYELAAGRQVPQEAWLRQMAGGAIQDIAPHSLAFLVEFAGVPSRIHCSARSTGTMQLAPCDEVRILAEGEKALGYCAISLGTQPYLDMLTLYGSKMCLELHLNHMVMIKKRKERQLPHAVRRGLPTIEAGTQLLFSTAVNVAKFLTGKLRAYPGVGELVRRFYFSVQQDSTPPLSLAHAREVVRLMEVMTSEMQGGGR